MEKEERKRLEKKQRETRMKKDIDRVLREIQFMEEEEERSGPSLEEDSWTPYLSLCSRLQLLLLNCERYYYVMKKNKYHKREQTLQKKSIKTGSSYSELLWLLEERRRLMVYIKQTELEKEEVIEKVWQRIEQWKVSVSSVEGEKEKRRGRRLYITWRPIRMNQNGLKVSEINNPIQMMEQSRAEAVPPKPPPTSPPGSGRTS
ncbi:uncharacterized protein LOC117804729 [Notolabrus celidotus]|uniref:uncharacterized protein LOC117804729 n=1 Tax=Notolabrus celidotus TaxID=1203425 RepID=UPI00148FB590|nr:uncharacterized protein LOC117804729 [Notolabrus celidotus]